MRILLTIALLLAQTLICLGQKQGNIWVFPSGNLIDFNVDPPVHASSGTMSCSSSPFCEGVASISDSSGALLFYSNGTKVWDGTHNVIPNGNNLLGHKSSTNGAYIVPVPGSDSRYYLFTTDAKENFLQNGLRYSIIDVCGKSGIQISNKNTLLRNNVTEKLAATRTSDGVNFWLTAHEHGTDRFFTWLITNSGIQLMDSASIGMPHPQDVNGAVGQMKFSPDGGKLALVVSNNGLGPFIELFDFNNLSGVINNPMPFSPDTLYVGQDSILMSCYGIAFSPNSDLIYVAPVYDNKLLQFDISSYNSVSDILDTKYVISNEPNIGQALHQMQLGPNGKILLARQSHEYLAVINSPNVHGIGCNFDLDGLYLGGSTSSWGLPAFVDSYAYTTSGICTPNGTKELSDTRVEIYPNPASTSSTITLPKAGTYGLNVIDATGRVVCKDGDCHGRSSLAMTGSFELNTHNWPQGIYAITATSQDGIRYTGRLVVGR